jgi:hypothetical protein
MRVFTCMLLLAASLANAATNYREIERAVADDALLASAGVEPTQAQMRLQCTAAILDNDDPPDFFDCVYVQTGHALNLFSLEDGHLMSELQLALTNIDGVALQHMGRYSQVQIFSGDRVAALYIHANRWIDPQRTETVYRWLREHGVPEKAPRKWIGP